MGIIATNEQTRWRDCFATSAAAKLTLVTNGEQEQRVITPSGNIVFAGFSAPIAVATLGTATTGGTILRSLVYYYVYVYASTQYPFVQNAQTVAGGELWPRSNPSPISASVTTGAGTDTNTVTVTGTKTTRSDIDKILFYATVGHTDADEALAAAQAGQYYYVGQAPNNGISGTVSLVVTAPTTTAELLELDNYVADTSWFCVFDGTYWWAAGNPVFEADVTLDGTSTVVVESIYDLFTGRDGQVATFPGINSGGYDGVGSFYAKVTSATTVVLYTDPDLTTPATFPFTGTTQIRLTGRSSVLYRSKPFNPFSWGFTEEIINADGSTTIIPQSFALEMGGGAVTAMAVLNYGKLLKIDFENPQRTITYDLTQADADTFGQTEKLIDNTGSVTGHFSQFQGVLNNQSVLMGLDTYNGNILACDGNRQFIISDSLGQFIANLDRADDAHRFFHGSFDPDTELNCWWVRYLDTFCQLNTLIWNHSATGQWGTTFDPNVQCSAVCLDSDTNERFLLGGSGDGQLGKLFDETNYDNWMTNVGWRDGLLAAATTLVGTFQVQILMSFDLFVTIIGQAITAVSPSTGTFTITGTPQCVVGDTVFLAEQSFGVVLEATGVVAAISGSNITLTAPWAGSGAANYVMVSPARMDGTWGMIYAANKKNQWYCATRFVSYDFDTLVVSIDQYFERGTTDVLEGEPAAAPWAENDYICFGNIPCYARFYFDLDSVSGNKRGNEAWLTVMNVDDHVFNFSTASYQLAVRQYVDFDSESTASRTFALKRDVLPNGTTPTDTWLTHTAFPSTELKQMGIEVSEIGYEAFQLYNMAFGVRKTS